LPYPPNRQVHDNIGGTKWESGNEISSSGEVAKMEQAEFYAKLLKLTWPWNVERVEYNGDKERVDIYIKHENGVRFPCSECGGESPVYDHTGDKEWRHLNTCQAQTYVHARLPRTNCKRCGVKLVFPPLGD
jgi:transposase